MSFRTKVDFSSNRQVKQFIETLTILSGGTSFGLTFSELPSGPDLTTTGITNSISSVASTFSGNSATTVYNWYDPSMSLGEPYFSAITPSNSAITQSFEFAFTASSSTVIDGNTVAITYSGVGFDILPISMYDLGAGTYSGTVESSQLIYYSANSLDFQGRTIWADVSGITRTERLIITDNPLIGYVWTCSDSEGMGTWTPVSGTTYANYLWVSGTSGTGSIRVNNGSGSDATGDYALAEGTGTTASGLYSHSEGLLTIASGISSHAEGGYSIAGGDYSHAEGFFALASGFASHAENTSTIASGVSSHAEGSNTLASGIASHAEGLTTIASGNNSHAEGFQAISIGFASHAEGDTTVASGRTSHAGGSYTRANGDYSYAGGYASIASGTTSFVHGYNSIAGGNSTIVLGDNITGTTANRLYIDSLDIKTLNTYVDNAAAIVGGLPVGTVYKTATGQLMIRY